MTNFKPILFIGLVITLASACTNFGKKLIFNNGELYYTSNVTEAEANTLGEFLVQDGFFAGETISVQLDKTGDTYLFRMVSKEGVENDTSFLALAETYTGMLSEKIFNGAPVDFHFCDTSLKTKKEIKYKPLPSDGKM
jgi:hypothetical protein